MKSKITPTPYDWSLVELDMLWGRRKYIYQGKTINGYPESVMHYDDTLGWQPCPNINVHKRIAEVMSKKQALQTGNIAKGEI